MTRNWGTDPGMDIHPDLLCGGTSSSLVLPCPFLLTPKSDSRQSSSSLFKLNPERISASGAATRVGMGSKATPSAIPQATVRHASGSNVMFNSNVSLAATPEEC